MNNSHRFRSIAVNRGGIQFVVAAVCIIALASSIYGQSGSTFQISPSTISGGGNTTTNGTQSLTGTIGQGSLGVSSGGTFSITGGLFSFESLPFKFGDANGDQIINVVDLFIVANFMAGNIKVGSPDFNKAAVDLNGDGLVNVQDLFILANYLAGNIHHLPVQ